MKRNIKLTIAYDGSKYRGWQRLKNTDNTIQGKIEQCLSKYFDTDISIIGSSRTDAGAHALDQVANFHVDTDIELDCLHRDLNRYLPEDIIIVTVEDVQERFHSRFWSDKKTYLYRIHTNPIIPPLFERHYVFNLGKELNLDKMNEAIPLFIGKKEFQGFSKRKVKKNTVRTIENIKIEQEGDQILIYLTADGFLYNMVRIIVGTLIEIGLGDRNKDTIKHIFETESREQAGFTAPAEGLVLYKNHFEEKK
ncbi:tRNA pseudouridine synthase A protein [Haloplasma contractile SSD-17B]|uniref:tRNA pseudouridine synthase A n=1 Tax=Haloplasma contractile SSD-17B TaxID=1033810 RepID=U2EDH8_9MOLU|nr:tRNA pseudouridine synthase A protein [Haloplasma contractile SSD-17B]